MADAIFSSNQRESPNLSDSDKIRFVVPNPDPIPIKFEDFGSNIFGSVRVRIEFCVRYFIINQYKWKFIFGLSISPTTDPTRLARIQKKPYELSARKFDKNRVIGIWSGRAQSGVIMQVHASLFGP